MDVWLIYKCSACDSTWNMTINSRTNPKSIPPEILAGFHSNNEDLATRYAMDTELILRNGAEVGLPKYEILGNKISFNTTIELHINSSYPSRLKISSLLREKMNLCQNVIEQMIAGGVIRSTSGLDVRKCRLQTAVILTIDKWTIENQAASS